VDRYEEFIRWYLRFNGFLTVENFIVHEPNRDRPQVPAGTESDILAVRFPHSKESPTESWTPNRQELRLTIRNHDKLFDDDAMSRGLIDFVIAEVKGGNDKRLNKTWRLADPTGRYLAQVEYLLRWLGPYDDESTINEIARCLRAKYRCPHEGYLFRFVYFSHTPYQFAERKGILQITFREVAEFFVDDRIACWTQTGLGVRSYHGQWSPLIRRIWEQGQSAELSRPQRVESILGVLETAEATDPDQAM
jgi:hypothetical protein